MTFSVLCELKHIIILLIILERLKPGSQYIYAMRRDQKSMGFGHVMTHPNQLENADTIYCEIG